MYRLVLLDDFDLYEMENQFAIDMQIETGGHTKHMQPISMAVPAKTDFYWVVRCVLVLVSFVMSTVLMNLFIGVLTVSYQASSRKSLVLFSRFRTSAAVETYAILSGWRGLRIFCTTCSRRDKKRRLSWGR